MAKPELNSVTSARRDHPFPKAYTEPRTGLLSVFPSWALPYAELSRVNKPGVVVIWVTHFAGLWQAAVLRGTPSADLLRSTAYFAGACQVLMWLNYAWNDTCDGNFDRHVPRTRFRPLARGALSYSQALTFDLILVGILLLLLVPLPVACKAYAAPLAFGCYIYPLSKRFTNFPQVVLGVVLAGGVFMGAAAGGVAALPYPSRVSDMLSWSDWTFPDASEATAVGYNYLTAVAWTIIFEVVYSYMDAKWDADAGIRTITRIFGSHRTAKIFLSGCAIIQTAAHAYVGTLMSAYPATWLASVCAVAGCVAAEIILVDLDNPASCFFWFAVGNSLAGVAILSGFLGEYMVVARAGTS